jgi:hypothetical protein
MLAVIITIWDKLVLTIKETEANVSVMKESKKAEIQMHLTEFEMPPMQDVVIVGRNAPIGPEALKRMVDVLSPDQYKIIKVDHPVIEAIVVRNALMNMIPEEKLSEFILEEGGKIVDESMIIKAHVNITVHVSKSIDL